MVDVSQPLVVTWYNNISGDTSITLTILNEATISIDNAEIDSLYASRITFPNGIWGNSYHQYIDIFKKKYMYKFLYSTTVLKVNK